ncbi:DUF455 domain-containing protein [Xylariaceae sp. FL0594]|nr:DUF455 domain-containing protein [Xylariaceae sp. FL0594]
MAQPLAITVNSYETALCILPPKHAWPMYDRLRSLYDKACSTWPPHLNLVYPFVRVEALPGAAALIASEIRDASLPAVHVRLNAVDVFSHKHDNTIFVYDADEERVARVQQLRSAAIRALGQTLQTSYRMHLTVGQSRHLDSAPHKYLMDKTALLPEVEWTVDRLFILVREHARVDGREFSQMKIWGTINLDDFSIVRADDSEKCDDSMQAARVTRDSSKAMEESRLYTNYPYSFSDEKGKWLPHQTSSDQSSNEQQHLDSFTLASYNVLAEFEHPPSQSRYPLVVNNILQPSILPDVLVLIEVTDSFLTYICRNDEIRKHYRYISQGPPDQPEIEPLPSHANVVVLSKWSFTWKYLPFKSRHKGSMIVRFANIGKQNDGDRAFLPTILATVHLTRGLLSSDTLTKLREIETLLSYLSLNHAPNPWILAGDFNIITSTYTIDNALLCKATCWESVARFGKMERALAEAGLLDAWTTCRVQVGDLMNSEQDLVRQSEIFEGEQGATFDPTANDLARKTDGAGFNNRPQRYDRILVKGEGTHVVTSFNLFGRRPAQLQENAVGTTDPERAVSSRLSYASDHWGLMCRMTLNRSGEIQSPVANSELSVPIHLKPAPSSLAPSTRNFSDLKDCLQNLGVIPTAADAARRKEAFQLLKGVVLEQDDSSARAQVTFVLAPVGSYGLGVWTTSSDIDCLCIGPISTRTFFALAIRRIRRAENKGVKLRRKVNSSSGIMLELEVLGIKMDLHYCPSSIIAETWPRAMRLPSSHPVFSLPAQTLSKLKPARDMYYIQRTIPDFAVFRTAHYFIRQWAKRRGVYAANFGLLSGFQISILLSRVCKMLSHDGRQVSLQDTLTTFFNHYASFDWAKKLVFDPFFHKQLRYVRAAREPMAILGFHPPMLNTALNASQNSVQTIAHELRQADALLSQDGMTWGKFSDACSGGYEDFLAAFKTFVRVDVQFWGMSLEKGSGFVGWLESRCVMLLVDLNRRLPNIHARIWPARFVDQDTATADESETGTEYQGYYLIGLSSTISTSSSSSCSSDPTASRSKEDDDMIKTTLLSSLHAALQKFEAQIRGDERYFDPNTSWMSASLVNNRPSLSDLSSSIRVDDRDWGAYTPAGDDDGFDDDDDEEEDDEEEEYATEDEILDADEESSSKKSKPKSKSKSRSRSKTAGTNPPPTGTDKKKAPLRSSADVMNRIRWDPSMDSGDFVVGYEDRFAGVVERALDEWRTESTDEEFVPRHRILYFRRRSDGVKVWDRVERRDDVFGSG